MCVYFVSEAADALPYTHGERTDSSFFRIDFFYYILYSVENCFLKDMCAAQREKKIRTSYIYGFLGPFCFLPLSLGVI